MTIISGGGGEVKLHSRNLSSICNVNGDIWLRRSNVVGQSLAQTSM